MAVNGNTTTGGPGAAPAAPPKTKEQVGCAMAEWMLYGANGYTGELVARLAVEKGQRPILAGRRAEAIERLAGELNLDAAIFDLRDSAVVQAHLKDVSAVLHCAGPFSVTSAPMVDACLATGTHYLDITGEIDVFEACHRRTEEAEKNGVVLLPGVGFDVVPTDCLAARLSSELPEARDLELAFHGPNKPSQGTAKTMVEGLSKGGAIRRSGTIEQVPTAWATKEIPFRDKPRTAVTIPWGDVSTAYYSTGIENIRVFMATPPKLIAKMKWLRPWLVRKILGNSSVQSFLKRRIEARVKDPVEAADGVSELWGRVEDASGKVVEGTLTTPPGYRLTASTALEAVVRVARGDIDAGTHTPSTAFGHQFIEEFEGCSFSIAT